MKKRSFVFLVFFLLGLHSLYCQGLEVSVQRGHSAAVLCGAVSPNGEILASAGKDKSIIIWEVSSGRELRAMIGHGFSIYQLAFDTKGEILASADADGIIKIWDYKSGKTLHSWKAHEGVVSSLKFGTSNKIVVSGGRDDKVKVWDWSNQKLLQKFIFDGGQYGVRVDVDASEQILLASGDNAKIYQVNLKEQTAPDTLRETSYSFCGGCYAEAKFSPDQNWILGVSHNGPLVLWNAKNKKEKIILEEKVNSPNNIQWSGDGTLLLVSQEDQTLIFDMYSKKMVSLIPKKDKAINLAFFSPDNLSVFHASDANIINQYSIKGDSILQFKGKLGDPIIGDLNLDPNSYWDSFAYKVAIQKNRFEVSPNGKWAIRGKTGNQAIIWDIEKGKPYRILNGHTKTITAFHFSPDNKMLLTGDVNGNIFFWDILTGDTLATKRFHFNMVLEFSFSNDGKTLATGGYDGYLNFINLADFSLQKRINLSRSQEYFDSPYSITFSPNDIYVVVGSLGKKLLMIEVDSGEEFKQLIGHTEVVSATLFFNNYLYSISWDGNIKSWDYRTGFQEWKLEVSELSEQCMLYIPGKNLLLTAGNDREIKIFDLATNQLIKKLKGHNDAINSLNYLPESETLISSSIYGEVIYWDLNKPDNNITQFFTGPFDYVILDQKGNFNATQSSMDAVIFVDGVESYQPEQFFNQYYKPDLQPLVYLSEGNKSDEELLSDVIKKHPPPKIEIVYPKGGEALNNPTINVMVRTTNTGGGVEHVQLSHNGKSIVTKIDTESKVQQRGKSLTDIYELKLLPGQNIIEVSAKNTAQIDSEKKKVVVNYTGVEPIKKCIILSIGINKYKNSKLDLNYAAADAKGVAELLKASQGSLFDKVELIEIYDKDATRLNILAELDKIAKMAGPSDTFYFYYAGHGSMGEHNFYFIPTDNVRLYDEASLKSDAISDVELQVKFKEISALKQVVIIDACQSGGGVQTLALRGANNEKSLAQLSRSAGVHVMASAGSEQFAAEFDELGHGLFTFTLIEALNGAADGAPKDGAVSVYELKSYLDARVPVYSEIHKGEAQYPHTFSFGQDFPVFIHQEE